MTGFLKGIWSGAADGEAGGVVCSLLDPISCFCLLGVDQMLPQASDWAYPSSLSLPSVHSTITEGWLLLAKFSHQCFPAGSSY